MDYKKLYKNLIESRKFLGRKKYEGELFHRHHIVPKSLGGSSEKENIVLLTPKEHFIAHRLLVKCQKNNTLNQYKMMCALKRFISFKMNLSPRQYEVIQKEHAKAASILNKKIIITKAHREKISKSLKKYFETHDGFFTGKKHTPEAIKKIIYKNSGKLNHGYGKPRPEKIRKKISKSMTGVKKSPEHAAKIRARRLSPELKKRISESITKWHANRKMDIKIS